MDAIRKEEIRSRWDLASRTQSDDDLKKIAKDIYNGLIFSDRHLSNSRDITSCFMILMLMGPQAPKLPAYPEEKVVDKQDSRSNAIYDVIQRDIDQKKYDEDLNVYLPYEEECYKELWLNNIGLIYEYLNSPNLSPRGINGNPCFMSARFLNKVDTEKMFGFYEEYKKIRETADSF